MRKKSIFRQLLINIILPILLALIFLIFLNYRHTKNLLVQSYEDKNYVIYDELRHLAEFQDIALGLLESSLDEKMKSYSKTLINNYLYDSTSIYNADLYKIREEIGMNPELEDIYVIDKNGIVIKTTYKKDLFLNFFDFGQEHQNYLLNILSQGEFVSERFTIEDATKRLRKYSYQPTPNGEFIIETGIYSEKADEIIETVKDRMINIAHKHNRILSIDLFIAADDPFSINKEVILSEEHKDVVKQVLKTKRNYSLVEEENGITFQHDFIYLERKNTDLYKRSVIRIISDRSFEKLFLRNELFKTSVILFFIIVIIIILVYRNTHVLTNPIEELVESIDRISEGNLKQRAKEKGSVEISKLARHFNKMLERIEQRAFENQQQKEEIASQAEQLSIINQELEKLSIVASKTVNGVAIFDSEGNLEWINSGHERIYGYTYNEIIHNIGRNIIEFNENPDIELLVNICQRTKQSIDFETLAHNRQNKLIWIQTTLTPILDEDNNIEKLVAIDSNISALKKVEEKLRQKNKDITDSINYAKRIQEAILPNISEVKEIFPESFVLYRPKGIVSGDFFWFKRQINKVLIASVDCTGHGIPGAFIGMLGNAFLNEIVNKNITATGGELTFPANQILNILREYVIRAFHKSVSENETKDGMDISLCIIDLETYKLQYSGAYSPIYLIRNEEIIEFKADKMPIGLFMKEKGYFTNHEIQLKAQDNIYLFSDGYIDQFGGPKGKKYLSKNFKKLLLEIASEPLERQRMILDETFENWKSGHEQVDDVLVMSVKIPEKQQIKTQSKDFDWKKKIILIAEDNNFNYKLIEDTLSTTKINLVRAKSGKEVIEFLNNKKIDLVLIDIYLPLMNGFDIIKKIRNLNKNVPIILQTSFTKTEEKDKVFSSGCNDYILKPINPQELITTLSKYIE